jgi:hypothetical protein
MRKWPVIVGTIFLFATILGGLALFSSQILFSSSWFRAILERKISKATGAKTTIQGELQGTLLPSPRLLIGGLSMEGEGDLYSLSIRKLELGTSLGNIVARRTRFDFLEATDIEVFLSPKEDLREHQPEGNFPKEEPSKERITSPAGEKREWSHWIPSVLGASRIELKDIRVEMAGGARLSFPSLSMREAGGVGLEGKPQKEILLLGKVGSQEVEVRGELKGQEEAHGLNPSTFELQLHGPPGIRFLMEGQLVPSSQGLKVAGRFHGSVSSLKDLLAKLNLRMPHLGSIRWGEFYLEGEFALGRGQGEISHMSGKVDGLPFTGSARIREDPEREIWLDLKAEEFNWDPLPTKPKKGLWRGRKPEDEELAPDRDANKSPLPQLISVPLAGVLRLDRLRLNGQLLEKVKFSFSLRDGVLSIHEFEAEIGGGVVRGEFEANLQAPVPDLTLKLATRGVDVGALLQGFAKTGFLSGPMDSEWELRGPWAQDLEEMLRHIEGKANIRISSGTIHGVDIPRMIRSFGLLGRKEKDDRDARTHFSKGSAKLLFHRGIIKVSRGSMDSEGVRIMAAGEADLIRRSLDFRLEPEIGSGAEGSSSVLVAPIWVSGSFSHPTFRPDLAGIRKRGEGPIKLSLPSKGELREMKKRLKEFLKPP